MSVIDTVNRIFREFKRYTGDGLPGEPAGAPLPVGDPQSGPHSPKKSELRAGFGVIFSGLEENVASAEEDAARAEAAANAAEAAVSSVSVTSFAAKAAAEAYSPAVAPTYMRLEGYSAAGDGGGALYKKVASEPAHAGKFSITLAVSGTIVWYEIAGEWDTRALGVVADSTDGTDGTDQTAQMVAVIASLGSVGYRGELHIPFGTKFDMKTIIDTAQASAIGMILIDDSAINFYNSPSYKTKLRQIFSSDLVNDDASHLFSSGHHPSIFLMNYGNSGSVSGIHRFSSILYGAGLKPDGEYMTGGYSQFGGQSGQWTYSHFLQTPFDIATKLEAWSATTAYAIGDIVEAPNGRVYTATVAGTSGAIAPTHASGTAVDGSVTWQFRQEAVETGGRTVWQINMETGSSMQAAVGPSSVKHTLSVHSLGGFGGYAAEIIADDQNNTTTLTAPVGGGVNLGKSGAPATISVPGITASNGSGSNMSLTLSSGASGGVEMVLANTVAAAHTPMRFYTAGTLVGSIGSTTSATAFNTSSDYRLKYEVKPLVEIDVSSAMPGLDPASALLMAMRPVSFKFHADDDGTVHHGFIAHELQEVASYAVTGEKDAVEEIGTAVLGDFVQENILRSEAREAAEWTKTGERILPQGVDQSKLVPDLVAAMQVIIVECAELRARVGEVERLLART